MFLHLELSSQALLKTASCFQRSSDVYCAAGVLWEQCLTLEWKTIQWALSRWCDAQSARCAVHGCVSVTCYLDAAVLTLHHGGESKRVEGLNYSWVCFGVSFNQPLSPFNWRRRLRYKKDHSKYLGNIVPTWFHQIIDELSGAVELHKELIWLMTNQNFSHTCLLCVCLSRVNTRCAHAKRHISLS